MTTRTLYEIGEDIISLNNLLDDIEGDISRCGESEPAVTAWLTSLGDEMANKLDGYVGLIRQMEMEAAAAKAEAEQWAAKAKSRESRVAFLKARLKAFMEMTNQAKITTATGRTIAIQGNGGQRPLVVSNDVELDAIPEQFIRTRREVDTFAVRAALDAGESLPFAGYGERGTSLRIR